MTIPFPLGNAPCSWGTIEGVFGDRLGYQKMLNELTETGYIGTELGDYGFMPTDPEKLRDALASRSLTMLGAFEGVRLENPAAHEDGEARVLRIARLLKSVADLGDPDWQPFIVLAADNGTDPVRALNAGRATPEMGLSDADWETFARGAERIATAVREEAGLHTVFHPHCAGYVETPAEISRFLELTDPELLGIVFDTGHYLYGSGQNDSAEVLRGLEQFKDRIWYVHFKDCSADVAARAREAGWDYRKAIGQGVFCELGKGSVPFPEVLDKLPQIGYQGWITVEQDVLPGMGTPKESARRNREYLASLGL